MHHAVFEGSLKIVEMLLQNVETNIDKSNNHGQTALHLSVQQGYFDITKKLIEAKACINCIDFEKNNLLHVCSLNGHIELLQYLIDKCPPNLFRESNVFGKIPKELTKNETILKAFEQEKSMQLAKNTTNEQPNNLTLTKKPGNGSKQLNVAIKKINYGNMTSIVNQLNSMASNANILNIKQICEDSPPLTRDKVNRAETKCSNGIKYTYQDKQITDDKTQLKFELKQISVPTTSKSNINNNSVKSPEISNYFKQPEKTDYEHMTTKIYKIGGASSSKQNLRVKKQIGSSSKNHDFSKTKKELNVSGKKKLFSNILNKDSDQCMISQTSSTFHRIDQSKTTKNNYSKASKHKPQSGDYILNIKGFDTPLKNTTVLRPLHSEPSKIEIASYNYNINQNQNEHYSKALDSKFDLKQCAADKQNLINHRPGQRNNNTKKSLIERSCSPKCKRSNERTKLISSFTEKDASKDHHAVNLSHNQIDTDSEESFDESEEENEDVNDIEEVDQESSHSVSSSGKKNERKSIQADSEKVKVIPLSIDKSDLKLSKSNEESNHYEATHANSSSLEEKIGPSSFICHALLGRGSFGEVYLVEKLNSKFLYAMKVLSKDKIMGNY